MGSDSQPHDAFFKALFGRPAVAADLLRRVLPAPLVAALDLDALEPVSPELIDEELRRNHADLVFRTTLRGGEVLVFFLLEHQRRPDPMMPWRLLVYMVRIWQRWIATHTEAEGAAPNFLPAILPVVVHNGAHPWTTRRRLSDLIRLEPELLEPVRRFLPELHLLVDDLPAADDAQLEGTASALATVALLFLKHGPYENPIAPHLVRWLGHLRRVLDQPGGSDALIVALRYLIEVNESAEPSALGEVLTPRLGPEAKELIMTPGQRLREEGRAEGLEEGRAEGLEEGREEGREEQARAIVFKMLQLRFRGVSEPIAARVAQAELPDLDRWIERILVAQAIDEVFVD
ncbi:MAG: Rpn family recombination-promoting nuclease/putative transposase [Myxococcales bacterium]|nr:Rpn family recombination-promoting nuclease/putative transposase [Myxococcales bacterium]